MLDNINPQDLIGKKIPLTQYTLKNPRLRGRRVEIVTPAGLDEFGKPIPGTSVRLKFKGGRLLTNNPLTIQQANLARNRHMHYVVNSNGIAGMDSLIDRQTVSDIQKTEKKAKAKQDVDSFLAEKTEEEKLQLLEKLKASLNQ